MADAAISMITLLREAKGWNQTELAREAGCRRPSFPDSRPGRSSSPPTAEMRS